MVPRVAPRALRRSEGDFASSARLRAQEAGDSQGVAGETGKSSLRQRTRVAPAAQRGVAPSRWRGVPLICGGFEVWCVAAPPCPTRQRLGKRFAGLAELVRLRSLIQTALVVLWPGCLGYHPGELPS